MGFEVEMGSGITEGIAPYEVINESGLSDKAILSDRAAMAKVGREISAWMDSLRATQSQGSMFDRSSFTPPANPYDEMRAAKTAMEYDNIVSGVGEITEAFAFQGIKFESTDADETDVFNQWCAEIDLDTVLRKMWRDEYSVSQFYVAMEWDWRTYTPRNKKILAGSVEDPLLAGAGDPAAATGDPTATPAAKKQTRKRRREFKLWVPVRMTILDPMKIVPVDFSPLADEKLAWCASQGEIGQWRDIQNGTRVDLTMQSFFTGLFQPSMSERNRLAALGVPNPDNLLLLNPEKVWRHTATKGDYEAYPTLRMKSIFPLLDLKRQLINSDRASLIGAANYILLVKKGDPQMPAIPEEIDNLKNNYNFIAKLPVIISDHRLNIEIIAPKLDLTLQGAKYDALDGRILERLLGTLSVSSRGQRNETNLTLAHAVARIMENRRHMMKRAIERNVIKLIVDHPKNQDKAGKALIGDEPSIVFMPRHVQLDFDQALLQGILGLRASREISRETTLEQFGLDQGTEAMRMEYEAAVYDQTFQTFIPYSSPEGQPGTGDTGNNQLNGAQGGRPLGGGQPKKPGVPESAE